VAEQWLCLIIVSLRTTKIPNLIGKSERFGIFHFNGIHGSYEVLADSRLKNGKKIWGTPPFSNDLQIY
jgi:hypothetical protein